MGSQAASAARDYVTPGLSRVCEAENIVGNTRRVLRPWCTHVAVIESRDLPLGKSIL